MQTMQCEQADELIGAYIDQELDAETRRQVAAHIGDCPACQTLADDVRRISGQVAAIGRELAPERLMADVRARIAEAGSELESQPRAPLTRWRGYSWLRQAAVLVFVCGLTAAAMALMTSRWADTALMEREVTAAHVRSLLQDSPLQIASTDMHTVKPWFAGRLDFSPTVKDLAADGFPLAGARLDYIGERRVAALVYRRRLHVVNVFMWPSADAIDGGPRGLVHKGYNIVTWTKGGIAYWAVSDLNMGELRQLQALL